MKLTAAWVDNSERNGVGHRVDILDVKKSFHTSTQIRADVRVVAANGGGYVRCYTTCGRKRVQVRLVIYAWQLKV